MFRFSRFSALTGIKGSATEAAITDIQVSVRTENLLAGFTIFLVAALSHIIFIPLLGYYWDDWIYLWDGLTLGVDEMVFQLSWDRPVYAAWHGVIFRILGDHTALWHAYFFVLLVVGGWLLVWALRGLWPQRRFATTAIGLLYVVYPGFTGQPFAHIYHIHFFALALGILSIGCTIRALLTDNRRTFWMYTAVAVASGAAYLFLYEIFVSFEALRLFLIIYIVARRQRQTGRRLIGQVVKYWLPYLGVIAVFSFWRVFIFKSVRTETDIGLLASAYQDNLLQELIRIPGEIARDFLETAIFAWFVPTSTRALQATTTTLLASMVVGLAAWAVVLLYTRWTYPALEANEERDRRSKTWARDVALIGFASAVLAVIPAILSNMELKLLELSDRYSLTTVVPVAVFVGGLVWLVARRDKRPWVIGALVGLSVMSQFNNNNYFRNAWETEMDLWWQMSWRVPDLEPDTVLMLSVPTRAYFPSDEHEIWTAASLIYAPEEKRMSLFGIRLIETTADELMYDRDYVYEVEMTLRFEVDYEKTLLVSVPGGTSCLRVIDAARLHELPRDATAMLEWVAPRSDINRIITDAPPPILRPSIFGREPAHTWCYYYQKADLARQRGNMEEVAALGDMARAAGFEPQDMSEWMPFIEGYVSVGRCEDARALAAEVMTETPTVRRPVTLGDCEG
jgi:hypothetical protein